MKTVFTLLLLFVGTILFSQSVFSPELSNYLQTNKSENSFVEINVFFQNASNMNDLAVQLDSKDAKFDERIVSVVTLLKSNAELSQEQFLSLLNEIMLIDKDAVESLNRYWAVNMINLKVKGKYLYQISEFAVVKYIDINSPRYRLTEVAKPEPANEKTVDGAEPGLKTVNAHKLWEMGYTGRNILFLSMDTGVFPDHPAISDNFAGNHFPLSQCWYGVRSDEPHDHASSSHGTHTTGTVLGLDPMYNDTIGVAYNSMWIASDPVASSDTDLLDPAAFMDVYQWVLDPDGNPETTSDVPKVINNSWGYDYSLAASFGACDVPEAEILVTLEVAGICSPFSAGNDGPGASTTGYPAMRAFNEVNPMAIGALTQSNTIASFSSRGPTPCIDEENSLQIKPEVCAPGVAVRSCAGHDSYANLQGTSMSCPHVSGVLLLLAEAFPQASAYELKYALYETAIDMGEEGEDNVYGRGLIDALEAYNYLALTYTPEPPVTNEYDISSEIQNPMDEIICPENKSFQAQISILNQGTEDIEHFTLKVYLNNNIIVDTIIELVLVASQEFIFTTETFDFDYGKNSLHSVVTPVIDYHEYDRFNNGDIENYYVIVEEVFPYYTSFNEFDENLSDSDWLIINPDNAGAWENLEWGSSDQYKALALNFGDYGTRNWEEDYANLPIVSLPNQDELFFNFTYAYKKRIEHLYNDSLLVEISTDCGLSFTEVLWRDGGVNMATVEGNTNLETYKPISSNEFDTVSLSLAAYKGEDVLIRFASKNDRGSVIYINNVGLNVNMLEDVNELAALPNLLVFPNPADKSINIKLNNIDKSEIIEFYSSSGLLVKICTLTNISNTIDISDLSAGIYFIRLKSNALSTKLIIQ